MHRTARRLADKIFALRWLRRACFGDRGSAPPARPSQQAQGKDRAADAAGGSVHYAQRDAQDVPPTFLARVWQRFFVEPFRHSEETSREGVLSSPVQLDRRLVTVMVVAALSLTAINYVGRSNGSAAITRFLAAAGFDDLSERLRYALQVHPHKQFHQLVWWVTTCVVCYFVVPALVVKLAFGERLRDYGLRVRGVQNGAWIYGLFFACMLPAVYLVSLQPHFLRTYPFYRLHEGEPLWPYLVCWEILYALQFAALEFFFRGFMVHGTKKRLGFYSVFAMMVPYCMIHFQKPLLECLGAIAAGIVLGTLSLKTRSIWLGAALHVGVAWTMDACALYRQGFWG